MVRVATSAAQPTTLKECMHISDAERLCALVNERLAHLRYQYAEHAWGHTLAVEGHEEIRFPKSKGGRFEGGRAAAWIANKHKDGRIHEPGLVATLVALAQCQPSITTIFDIGALYGYVGLVARSLFEEASVHAFEVNPRSYRALQRNITANEVTFGDSVEGHHCALDRTSAPQAPMRIHRFGATRLDEHPSSDAPGGEHQVDIWSLDDLCRETGLSPDLIKLDVEGYQARIIPGAMEVVARSRPIILLEFDVPNSVNSFGVTNRDVIRPLLDDGYRLIWGRHRRAAGEFRVLRWSDLTDDHEVNSLAILVP